MSKHQALTEERDAEKRVLRGHLKNSSYSSNCMQTQAAVNKKKILGFLTVNKF